MRRRLLTLLVIVLTVVGTAVATSAPAAAATPPANDLRAHAQVVTLPSTVQGTTVDATVGTDEPRYFCGWSYRTVWYRVTVPDARGMVVSLSAHGNLDAILGVFKQRRSQLDPVGCDATDTAGKAAVGIRPESGATYYIRVAEQRATESNTFTLQFVRGAAPATPQGSRPLPSTGASGVLDRVLHTDVAYNVQLAVGRPYRMNLVRGDCMAVQLFAPDTVSFATASPVWTRYCAHIPYGIYTPPFGAGGRYFVRVTANPYVRTPQPYRFLLAPAAADDVAPGLPIDNWRTRTGYVDGGSLDVLDLYHFAVAARSRLDLRLTTPANRNVSLTLLTDSGQWIACACNSGSRHQISMTIPAGRYYAVVRSNERASSKYYLTRATRTVTVTTTWINGRHSATTPPGQSVRIGVRVSALADGRATVSIQHFDPLEGWLPYRQHEVTVSRGAGSWQWTPPVVGRWRVRAEYAGTTRLAPSASGYASLLVARPLVTASRNQLWAAA